MRERIRLTIECTNSTCFTFMAHQNKRVRHHPRSSGRLTMGRLLPHATHFILAMACMRLRLTSVSWRVLYAWLQAAGVMRKNVCFVWTHIEYSVLVGASVQQIRRRVWKSARTPSQTSFVANLMRAIWCSNTFITYLRNKIGCGFITCVVRCGALNRVEWVDHYLLHMQRVTNVLCRLCTWEHLLNVSCDTRRMDMKNRHTRKNEHVR